MPRKLTIAGGIRSSGFGAVQYTGSQYMTGPGSGTPRISAADEQTLSMWIRLDANDGAAMTLFEGGNFLGDNMRITRDSSNKFNFNWLTSAGGSWGFKSNNSYTSGPSWIHLLAAWKKTGDIQQLYINSSSDLVSTATGGTPNLFLTNAFVTSGPSQLLRGAVSQIWWDDSYMDISNGTNRAKFISSGHPVDLGVDGVTPTGSQPLIFLDGAAATAGQNSGSTSDFTVVGTPVNTAGPT